MQLKLALPKGRLLGPTSTLLQELGLEISGYEEQSRSYRPQCNNSPNLFLKIFNEKDVPVQVAVGNYDMGICGQDWVAELLAKYPASAIVKVKDLRYGERDLCMVANNSSQLTSMNEMPTKPGLIRIVSEYPNLAESFALNLRLRRCSIIPVWGAAEVYPPESADLALISRTDDIPLEDGLSCLTTILHSSAFLIAHRPSWESKNMNSLLQRIYAVSNLPQATTERARTTTGDARNHSSCNPPWDSTAVRLALPDGHQQAPTLQFLERGGIRLGRNAQESRRPGINLDGVCTKIVRPQDMPLQVANGNFDLAITGEDWLYEHLCRFPSSPARKILTLGFGKVKIVAVVSKRLPCDSTQDLRSPFRRHSLPTLRIASEYTNIADKFARDNHLSPYRLLPTWGASEAFIPEDADVLIENTQTGRTLAQHNLKIVDTLFESSACLIGNMHPINNSEAKNKEIARIIELLSKLV